MLQPTNQLGGAIKLYMHPNARKPRAVVLHLGLEIEQQTVAVQTGENRTPEYLVLNPNGKVPVLVDGDLVLWESNAIAIYLAKPNPAGGLWVDTAAGEADVLRCAFWCSNHMDPPIAKLVFQAMFVKEADEAVVESATADFARYAAVLNGALADTGRLVGGR